jgi:hypothetical protein
LLIPLRQIKISLITAPEFNLEYLWWLTILFMVLSVLYFVGIFLIRNRISANNGRTKQKKVEFSPMISEFLFFEDSNTKEEKMNYLNLKIQIRELIKDQFDRNVLIEVLLDLRKDLSGQSQTVLIELYKDLGLHHDAYEKLSSRRWQIVSSGILELTTMEVHESYGLILKFINHRQSTIRKQAEIAVVNLKEEGIGYFLDNTKYKISEWQQLKLLDVLRHKPNFNPPAFGLWLTSSNTHVVLFSLRLIKYYRQSNAEQSIITLLKHKKRDIQAEAIDCIKEFYFVDAIPTLKLVYAKASHDIKIAILDAIGEIGSESDVEFLDILKNKERNFNIKGKIIGTLNKIDPERILPTKNISNSEFFAEEIETPYQDEEVVVTAEDQTEFQTLEKVIQTTVENKEREQIEGIMAISEKEPVKPAKIDHEAAVTIDSCEDVLSEDINNKIKITETQEIIPTETGTIDMDFVPKVIEEATEVVETLNNIKAIGVGFTIDFLPMVIEETTSEEVNTNAIDNNFEVLFTLDDDFHIKDETKVVQIASESENEIDDIDWDDLSNEIFKKNEQEEATIEEPQISFEHDTISFSANFMEPKELDAMVLLENIAEMGDCRELPVLQEIIATHTSLVIIDRATELIQKFSYQTPRPHELFSNDNDLSESVFTEIYNLSDEETKFILLDEIGRIGDVKEMQLLKMVIASDSKLLAKKAKMVLEQIESKIAPIPTAQLVSVEDENSLFEVDFELELNESLKSSMKSNEIGSTLFDQLCSMSNNFYNKING